MKFNELHEAEFSEFRQDLSDFARILQKFHGFEESDVKIVVLLYQWDYEKAWDSLSSPRKKKRSANFSDKSEKGLCQNRRKKVKKGPRRAEDAHRALNRRGPALDSGRVFPGLSTSEKRLSRAVLAGECAAEWRQEFSDSRRGYLA